MTEPAPLPVEEPTSVLPRGYFDAVAGNEPGDYGLLVSGGRLTTDTALEAYSRGMFPWTGRHPIPWCSPDPRLVLEPARFTPARSLASALRSDRFAVSFDGAFGDVMRACATVRRTHERGTWITPNMLVVYGRLHAMGYVHSVEVRDAATGALVGGLYGVSLGRAFFGESMFHTVPNASKVALAHLCRALAARDYALIDCQQETPHLASLGGVAIPRQDYLARLAVALARPTLRGSWASWAGTWAR